MNRKTAARAVRAAVAGYAVIQNTAGSVSNLILSAKGDKPVVAVILGSGIPGGIPGSTARQRVWAG